MIKIQPDQEKSQNHSHYSKQKQRKNPAALHSIELIINSMFQLMENEDYSKITISEIAANAKVHRRTFYRHFKTREDVVSSYFDMLCEDYINALRKKENLSLPNITEVFFSFSIRNLKFLQLLERNNLLPFLLQKLNEYLPSIYTLLKGDLKEGRRDGRGEGREEGREDHQKEYADEQELRYILSYSVGGYWNMLCHWLKEGADKTPEELADLIKRAIQIHHDYGAKREI